jgi:hypothetical protein
MPLTTWERPRYNEYEVMDLVTVAPKANHEDRSIGRYPEHVLMLLREEWRPGVWSWGVAWLVRDAESGRWGQRLLTSGPSRDNGGTERRAIRDYREQITGVMS